MSKSFWQGFKEGYLKAGGYGLVFALGILLGRML